jgi:O-antigen/teichoic acid export membrane protein
MRTRLDARDPTVPTTPTGVIRNTMFLVVAKVLSTPIMIANHAMLARFLGAEDFGYLYVAQTYASFGTLLITWGQASTLPAATARDRSRASELLGSGLLLRACVAAAVCAVFAFSCRALTVPGKFRLILIVVFAQATVAALTSICQDIIRGFERTDIDALLQILGPLLGTVAGFAILVLGGRVPALMVCGAFLNLLLLEVVRRPLVSLGVRTLSWSRETVRSLMSDGWPFLFYGFAMALQPAIDATFLSKLAPAEVVGWHAVATKFVGLLVFPAGALMASLYPALCRLHVEDPDAFRRSLGNTIRASTLLVVPVTLGCFLFPDLAIRIFSRASYGPAQNNLRILSVFVFVLYFTMPLGTALLAAGRQRAWSLVQCLCVVLSVVLDPLLVPWFQRHTGNGGLGICTSTVISECAMLVGAIMLTPRGVLHRNTLLSLAYGTFGGAGMVITARALSGMTSVLAAPISLLAYVACLFASGALGKAEMAIVGRMLSRKFLR